MLTLIASSPDWVVTVKPFGVLSEDPAAGSPGRTKPGRPEPDANGSPSSMPALLREALAEGGIPFDGLFPVHRLDRTTEGLMLWATNRRAAGILSKAVADGAFRKTYLALLGADSSLPSSGELRDFLFFDRRRDKSFVVTGERKGAKEAVLRYSLEAPLDWRGHPVTPARVELMTGRTHQIRVQFASRKSPLAGDGKYGSRLNFKGPALFCTSLSFPWAGRTGTFTWEPESLLPAKKEELPG